MSLPGPVRGSAREALPVLAPVAIPPGVGMVAGPRSLHVELHTQQRRLRHLRSIAARNIVSKNGHRLLDTYFTLHLLDGERIYKEFYKSEVVKDSLNPTWRSLDFGLMPDRLDASVSCFIVRVWGGKNDNYHLLIEWKVNLSGLKYLGPQIHACNPNEIIFGLNDGYYGASFENKDNTEQRRNSHLQVEQNVVRNSYGLFSLLRLHRAQCVIKQTQVTVHRIGKEIEEKLRVSSSSNNLKESECLRLKILVLQDELERQKKVLGREVELLNKERNALNARCNKFSSQCEKLQKKKESLEELQKECTAKRESLVQTNAFLSFRCRQLLSELSYIYPIDVTDQKDYYICGVKLPNSEDFQAKDDGSVAVALGYTAHLVSMISFILNIPLRYPILYKGSRSSIKDNINDKLTEKEREFPLYPKGGEKLQFDYGVYLLNKNIAQLRYQHSLGTPDLRQTLPNLKVFLDQGLQPEYDAHHTSSAIPVPKRDAGGAHGGFEPGYCSRTPTPERGHRIRTSSETERFQYSTSPSSYKASAAEPIAILIPATPLDKGNFSFSLDASMDSSREYGLLRFCDSFNCDSLTTSDSHGRSQADRSFDDSCAVNGPFLMSDSLEFVSQGVACPVHSSLSGDLHCAVEQAEEIVGTEASNFTSGDQLEEFSSIPVDRAVAVECDEQVLGEFEEFSRRIYALNENMSSFRRPRKNSDK
ncbi:UV radiation resistance-associated gene protein isoform 2-T2 [Leptodactylus fuscus]|uniref:UV radiation resistance-associated gene protein isoform X2 n=1 Tax=Leptodactylus fuscus TaxID=238119 RepID=UPI003F4E6A62